MRRSLARHFIAQRKLHGPIDRQRREMDVIFVVEHDLLAVSLRGFVVHAAVASLAGDFVEGGAVVGEDAEKRGTA